MSTEFRSRRFGPGSMGDLGRRGFEPLEGRLPLGGEDVLEVRGEIGVPDGTGEGHVGDVGLVAECLGCEGLRSRERFRDVGSDIDPVLFLALDPVDRGEDDAWAVGRLGAVLFEIFMMSKTASGRIRAYSLTASTMLANWKSSRSLGLCFQVLQVFEKPNEGVADLFACPF